MTAFDYVASAEELLPHGLHAELVARLSCPDEGAWLYFGLLEAAPPRALLTCICGGTLCKIRVTEDVFKIVFKQFQPLHKYLSLLNGCFSF